LKNSFKKVYIDQDITKSSYGNFYNRPRDWVAADTTVKINENAAGTQNPGQFFRSKYGASASINGPAEYEVAQFHFHHKSEHTIEGVHFDIEMHIVHFPAPTATTA
jgi:carbonic anhydrase